MSAMHEQAMEQDDTFLDLVDFKWLMAGVGWWVELSRLQRDTAYAGEWVRLGLQCDSDLVRRRSVDLQSLLERSRPGGIAVHRPVADTRFPRRLGQ